ncbi:MAG TPA: SDR family oxidoreductase [Vicinamibacteria bacterium]|nr:SDR family oxidoreductase [Vicinamibacteria bacterium]
MRDDSLFRLDGRVAAVIGAGSGIGEATALACARQGAHVVCLDADAGRAEAAARAIAAASGSAESATLDIREGAAVTACLEGIRSRHGRLDALVATPGVNVRKPLLAYSVEEFERVVALNLRGSFNVLRAAGAIMIAAGRGSIVLVSSIRSVTVEPGQSVYSMTKAGIVQLVRAAAAELGPGGVRVNALAPGVVDTPLTAPIKASPGWHRAYAEKAILKRWATPEEMAGPAVFLLSDAASYVTGAVLFADGGWTAADGRFEPPGM